MYAKTCSRELLSTLNRVGVTSSYNDERCCRNLLCAYTVKSSHIDGVPIPSHFSKKGWTFGVFDNEDFEDQSSISGTHNKHYTAQVLYQNTLASPRSKPSVSSTGLPKSSYPSKYKLPCQVVPLIPVVDYGVCVCVCVCVCVRGGGGGALGEAAMGPCQKGAHKVCQTASQISEFILDFSIQLSK